MLFLSKWQWYLIAAGAIVWSMGVWHVSGTYATANLVQDQLQRNEAHAELATKITQKLEEDRAKYETAARQATKDLFDELLKDPRYKSCRVTDGVRDAIKRKLDAQPD